MSMMYKQLSVMALCALIGATACGGDDGNGTEGNSRGNGPNGPPVPSGPTGSSADAQPATAAAPVYVASTRVFTPDGTQTTTYVQVLNSLDQGTKIETSKATEFGGPAELFSINSPRWVAVGAGESPELSRFSLNGQTIKKEETLSVHAYGLESFFSNKLYQVSPTKVYLPDPDNAQLIMLDPTRMTVLGAVKLPSSDRTGYTPVYSYDYVQRQGKLLFTVAWFDWTNDKILPETGLIVLDTNTDTVLRTDVDTRCGGLTQPITLASGDTYFPSSSLAAASYQLKRLTTEPCVLRVKANTDTFDASYHVKLRELTGAVAGEPVPAGGDELFLRVLDPSLATIKPETASWDLTAESAWRWRRWNPLTNALVNVDALKPSTANTYWFEVDGRVFNSETTSDYASTTLIELNAPGGPKPALTGPGLINGLARIQ
jgi:hypothetical protein